MACRGLRPKTFYALQDFDKKSGPYVVYLLMQAQTSYVSELGTVGFWETLLE